MIGCLEGRGPIKSLIKSPIKTIKNSRSLQVALIALAVILAQNLGLLGLKELTKKAPGASVLVTIVQVFTKPVNWIATPILIQALLTYVVCGSIFGRDIPKS